MSAESAESFRCDPLSPILQCSSTSTSQKKHSAAKSRWNFASQVLRSSKAKLDCKDDDVDVPVSPTISCGESKRKLLAFGLFRRMDIVIDNDPWTLYLLDDSLKDHRVMSNELDPAWKEPNVDQTFTTISHSDPFPRKGLFVQCSPSVSRNDIQSFDNTGNICIWPCEEVLAYYCMKNKEILRGKRVCELGGGMTCLAGNLIAYLVGVEFLLLTDGNPRCVSNTLKIVDFNRSRDGYKTSNTVVKNLRWDFEEDWKECTNSFDYVVAADCLFLPEYHLSLLTCLHRILRSNGGVAWLFAPYRNTTLVDFTRLAEKSFHVRIEKMYDPFVWKLHRQFIDECPDYKPDVHYPVLITLRKLQETSSPYAENAMLL